VIKLHLPPLRERKEDILPLAEFFIRKHTAADAAREKIPPELESIFLAYHWPGNIRELENTVRKFIVFGDAAPVVEDLQAKTSTSPTAMLSPCPVAAPIEVPRMEHPAAGSNGSNGHNGTNGHNGANGHSNGASHEGTSVLSQVAAAKREAERTAILAALAESKWNRRQASVALQIDYKALLYKMKVLAIKKEPAPASGGMTAMSAR
jgi:two-component system response regulator AtoC